MNIRVHQCSSVAIMSKKLTESKTYVSADGKVAKTYYPDGKLVVQFSRHRTLAQVLL